MMVRLVGFNSCIFFFFTFGCAFYQAWSIKGEKRCDWGPFGRWATCGVHQRAIRMMRRDERLQKPGRPHSVRPQLHTQHKMCPIGMTMSWMKWHTIYRYNNIYTVVSWGAQDRRLCCVAWTWRYRSQTHGTYKSSYSRVYVNMWHVGLFGLSV